MFVQVVDVRVAAQEPQEFVDDRFQMQLLRRQDREASREIETHLVAEDAERARTRAVVLGDSAVPDRGQQVQVLLHAVARLRGLAAQCHPEQRGADQHHRRRQHVAQGKPAQGQVADVLVRQANELDSDAKHAV